MEAVGHVVYGLKPLRMARIQACKLQDKIYFLPKIRPNQLLCDHNKPNMLPLIEMKEISGGEKNNHAGKGQLIKQRMLGG